MVSGQHVGKNIAWGGHHCHGKTPASLDVFKNSWVLQSSENKRERAVLIPFNVTKYQILSNSQNPVDVCQNRIDWRCFSPGRIVLSARFLLALAVMLQRVNSPKCKQRFGIGLGMLAGHQM